MTTSPKKSPLHTPGGKFGRKREIALAALLSCKTIKEAARKIGVNERTLRAWMAEPDFANEFQAAKRELIQGAVNILRSSLSDFAQTWRQIALTGNNETARVNAAARGWEALYNADVTEQLEERLRVLERHFAGRKP